MTLTQLRKYRLKDVKGKKLTDEKIPTLEEVFEIIATHPDITLHIEVKTHNMLYENIEEKVLEIVEKCGSNRNIVYSSFHLPTLIRLKQLAANARVAFLFNRPIPHIHDYVATFQLDGVHPRKDVYMSYESLFRNSGNVRVWTPNSKRDLTRLLQANIAAVITKEPDRALAIRKDISQF